VLISEKPTEFPVRSPSGKILFYFDKKASGAVPYNNMVTILLRLSSILVLFLFIHRLAESETKKKRAVESYWPSYLDTIGFSVAYLLFSICFQSEAV
jgi:hypothetical protein